MLAADREPWLTIAPKPLNGDPHYELAPMLWNRWDELAGLAAAGVPLDNPMGIPPAAFLSQVGGTPYGTGFTGLGALDRYEQNAKSLALFTNNTWRATDALDVTLGLRYTREDKELTSDYSNPNGSLACTGALTDQNPLNPARYARLRAALASRSTAFAGLPGPVQDAIMASAGPQIAGYMCLPWANALHNGRSTFQESEETEWSGTLKAAYRHRGFSFVRILQRCPKCAP